MDANNQLPKCEKANLNELFQGSPTAIGSVRAVRILQEMRRSEGSEYGQK